MSEIHGNFGSLAWMANGIVECSYQVPSIEGVQKMGWCVWLGGNCTSLLAAHWPPVTHYPGCPLLPTTAPESWIAFGNHPKL